MANVEDALKKHGLIDIKLIDPSIHVDLAYATANNFMNKKMYSINQAYMLEPVAQSLSKAQSQFKAQGYTIKVLDAYRPFSVQEEFWQKYPKPTFLAQPIRNKQKLISGSKHNRGAAVDITLVDENGKELAMPTPFDEFSPRAARNFKHLPEPIKSNVTLLEEIMHSHQFMGLPSEWWHFDYIGWEKYPLVDIPL